MAADFRNLLAVLFVDLFDIHQAVQVGTCILVETSERTLGQSFLRMNLWSDVVDTHRLWSTHLLGAAVGP